jgi:hypothetical protein
MTRESDFPLNTELRRIIYISRIVRKSEQSDASIVFEIDTTSNRRNSKSNVSGCLLLVNGWFIQLLEGPSEAVESTLARIAIDPRHNDLQVIENELVKERIFSDWAMCAAAMSSTDAAICDVVGRPLIIIPEKFVPSMAISLLQAVRIVQQRRATEP